ncbi:hypothetical protein B0H34DRAFT_733582 [Crassisporium funariophilum]|nr:hypothetical protein B0H34DRAFT_733582 [Crassisporium funariophilum]
MPACYMLLRGFRYCSGDSNSAQIAETEPQRTYHIHLVVFTLGYQIIQLMASSQEIYLPAELEREIFEIAASAYPSCVVELVRVARRVQEWVSPELYRVLRAGEGRVVPPIYCSESDVGSPRTLDIPRLKNIGPHVQHILLQKWHVSEIQEILKYCPNVRNLALWIVRGSCLPLLPVLSTLSIRRLSFDPLLFFPSHHEYHIPFDQPLFWNITHLEIINAPSEWKSWHKIALMPKLSHLALSGELNQALLDDILENCTLMELLIVISETEEGMTNEQHDRRVVVLEPSWDYLDHWELGARGGDDFWIIAAKRAAESKFPASVEDIPRQA